MSNFFEVPIDYGGEAFSIWCIVDNLHKVSLHIKDSEEELNQLCDCKTSFGQFKAHVSSLSSSGCQDASDAVICLKCNQSIGALLGTGGSMQRFISSTSTEINNNTKRLRNKGELWIEAYEETKAQIQSAVYTFRESDDYRVKKTIVQKAEFVNYCIGVFTTLFNLTVNDESMYGKLIFQAVSSQSGSVKNAEENKAKLVKYMYEISSNKSSTTPSDINESEIGASALKKYFSVGAAISVLKSMMKKYSSLKPKDIPNGTYVYGIEIGAKYFNEIKLKGKDLVAEIQEYVKLVTFFSFLTEIGEQMTIGISGAMKPDMNKAFGTEVIQAIKKYNA